MLKSKFTFKRVLLFIVMLAGFLVLVGCAAKADSITLSDSSLTLTVGDKKTVTATVLPEDVESVVTWESDKPEFATVSATGEVTAVAAGTATITATIDEKSATVTVTVVLEKFNVTFESNGGGAVPAKSVDKGGKVAKPTDPTQTGLSFKGWFTDSNLTQAYDFNTVVNADLKLYARWESDKITITFDSNGGSEVPDGQVNYGSKLSSVQYTYFSVPNRVGYTFKGWHFDEELESLIDFDKNNPNIIEDLTVYAKWETKNYNVTFNSNGGTAVTTASVEFTTAVAKPSDPTKAGWVFAGWFKEAALTNAYTFTDLIPANDFTLYAKWTPGKTKVSFNANGGTGIDSIEVTTTNLLEEPDDPEKIGYVFKGWYKEAGLVNAYDFEDEDAKVEAPFTLYAKWELPADKTAAIKFNMNDGRLAGSSYKLGSYNGGYWSYYASDVFLYKGGVAEANQLWAHVIGLKVDGGLLKVDKLFLAGTAVSAAEAATMDYLFVAHGDNPAGYAFLETMAVGQYISISGFNFVSAKTGKVDNGVIHILPATAAATVNLTLPKGDSLPIPAKPGHRFAGWYTDEEFEEAVVTTVSEDDELFAKWTKAPTITFVSSGGSAVASQLLIAEKATLPANPTKTNLFFDGWFTNSELTAAFDFDTAVTADLTVYAKWALGVEVVYMDGTKYMHAPYANMLAEGSKLAEPATPIKKDFLFDGWYTDATFTTEYDFENSVNANLVLYSKWTAAVAVTLYDGTEKIGETYSTRVGAKLKQPTDPVKAGNKVEGWYTEAALTTKYNFDANVPADTEIKLYVKWDEAVVVSYKDGEAAIEDPFLVKKGTKITEPAVDPIKAGYDFVGWFSDAELKTAFDFTKTLAVDTTVYAKFIRYEVKYNLDGGVFTYETKNAMLVDFLTDFYDYVDPAESLATFIHGFGKTSGFGGTWYTAHRNAIYDGTEPTEADDDEDFFIYQTAYFTKWMPLFDTVDDFVKAVDAAESFYDSIDFGLTRLNQYITNVKPNADVEAATMAMMPAEFAVVKLFTEVTETFSLAKVEKEGYTFGGWFKDDKFTAPAITEVVKGTKADVTVYAKWTAIPAED